MKGKQVAERGQQKPGQPLAQARERVQPQAGVWTRAGIRRGRQKEGKTDSQGRGIETQRRLEAHVERRRDRYSEMDGDRHTETESQGEMKMI